MIDTHKFEKFDVMSDAAWAVVSEQFVSAVQENAAVILSVCRDKGLTDAMENLRALDDVFRRRFLTFHRGFATVNPLLARKRVGDVVEAMRAFGDVTPERIAELAKVVKTIDKKTIERRRAEQPVSEHGITT